MSIGIKLKLRSLYKLVESDIESVDAFIKATLRDGATKASLPLLDHILESPGKRVRPLLVLFSFYAVTGGHRPSPSIYDRLICVASALEVIHTASLVHDDVIDDAMVRRDQDTVNAKWGNPAAVAMGVYLYSVSLELIAKSGLLSVLSSLSVAVRQMCNGELYQLSGRNNVALSKEQYLEIIKCKTADLFEAACVCGAYVAEASDDVVRAMALFGYNLGMLFQLTDDYLDFFGADADLSKAVGQDLEQGQVTLPVLLLLERLEGDDLAQLKTIIHDKDTSQMPWLKAKMSDVSLSTYYADFMKTYRDAGKQALGNLPDSSFSRGCSDLLDIIFSR